MSEIQEQILDAVKLLADSAVNQSNATLTIECEIVDIVDAAIGLYKVNYLTNQFEVYANPAVTYQVGDLVYVLVPAGDFEKTKTIIGAVAPSAEMYTEEGSSSKYVEISDNLLSEVKDDNITLFPNNITINTYNDTIKIDSKEYPQIDPEKNYNEVDLFLTIENIKMLADYIQTNRNFVLSAKIKTNIEVDRRNTGNYGLILTLPIVEEQKVYDEEKEEYVIKKVTIPKTYTLDITNIQGNPYGLNEFALQNLYLEFAEDVEFNFNDENIKPKLTIFVQDFVRKNNNLPADIQINDISFKVLDVLNEEQLNGYYLTLVSTEGNYFINDYSNPIKTLTPILKVNGKDKKLNGYECYWFVEDSSVDVNNEDYFALGGLGWRCLNQKTNVEYNEENRMTFQYVTNIYKLNINKNDVKASLRYKCIVVKDSIVVSAKILIKNLSSNIEIKLSSATGYTSFVKNTGYINLIASISNIDPDVTIETIWQRYDENGNYLDNNFYEIVKLNEQNGEWLNTEIKFPCSIVENLNVINCTFYSVKTIEKQKIIDEGTPDEVIYNYTDIIRTNLGTESIMVTTSENFTYKLVIDNGDILYKYDADGDSPRIADYDGPLSSKISAIQPLKYRIFKADGTELNETEYAYCNAIWKIPINSMFKLKTGYTNIDQDYYYIEGLGQVEVQYDISSTYNIKKNNNTIFLNINFQNIELSETTDIRFTKDGAGGTNGSKYAAIITYRGYFNGEEKWYGYGEIDDRNLPHKFHPVQIQQNESSKIWNLCDPNYVIGKNTGGNVIEWHSKDENAKFKIQLYKDGENITSTDSYKVEWSIFDKTSSERTFDLLTENENRICYITQRGKGWDNTNDKNNFNVLQAKIIIDEKQETQQEIIYAYYPIEMSYFSEGINNPDTVQIVPELNGGFDQVLYASDGTNPKYDNSNPFIYGDNLIGIDAGKYFEISWHGNKVEGSNLKWNDGIVGIECPAKPVNKYDNGNSYNYIKAQIDMSKESYDNIKDEKIADTERLLNGIEKKVTDFTIIKNNAEEFIKSFNWNELETYVKNSKELLQYRGSMINFMTIIQDAFEDIAKCCNNNNIDSTDFDCHYIETNTVLKEQRRILFTLGKENINLNDLIDLKYLGFKISKANIKKFKKKYGIAVWEELKGYINIFNTALGVSPIIDNISGGATIYDDENGGIISEQEITLELKYLSCLELIKQQIDGKINFTNIINFINNLANNDKLAVLTELLQDYIVLKNELISYVDKLTMEESDIYLYDKIYNNIILSCKNWFDVHNQDFYIGDNGQLAKDLKNAEDEKDKLASLLEQYKAIIAAPLSELSENYVKRIAHIKPIIMILNRYEMSNLNGWDGNKLYTDPNNDEYLFAPQIGAGKKNIDNSFTGIVMGVKNFAKSSNNTKIGLFGYSSGIQSIFLNADDGSATFGRSGGGQIIIDPNVSSIGSTTIGNDEPQDREIYPGLLYSSNFWKEYNPNTGKPINYSKSNWNPNGGMLINLTAPEIRFGSGNFVVTASGHLTAKGGGSIAGWEINDHNIFSNNNNNKLYLNSEKNTEYINNDTTKDSFITNGKIYSGEHSTLYSTKNGFYLSQNGLSISNTIRISAAGNGKVEVGRLSGSKKWTINGNTNNSYIAYNTTSFNEKNKTDSVYIGTNGISLGYDKFYVTSEGELHAKEAYIEGDSQIGDWTIYKGKIVGNKDGNNQIILDANGAISGGSGGNTWSINRNGNATFKNITCDGTFKITHSGGEGEQAWTNTWSSSSGFSFAHGNIGMGGSAWGTGGFSGGGTATYGSTLDNPLKGKCITQVDTLIANKITADYIKSKIATIATLTTQGIKATTGNISAETGSIIGVQIIADGIDLAKKAGAAGTYTVTDGKVTIPALKSS